MSKIDEIIAGLANYPLDYDFASDGRYAYPDRIEHLLKGLESLRPYVELGELVYENQATMYIKDYDKARIYNELCQQIKENQQ